MAARAGAAFFQFGNSWPGVSTLLRSGACLGSDATARGGMLAKTLRVRVGETSGCLSEARFAGSRVIYLNFLGRSGFLVLQALDVRVLNATPMLMA